MVHFKLPDLLKQRRDLPCGYVSRKLWTTPEPLFVLAAHVCNDIPELLCFKWTNQRVLQWIESLGFPQYRHTFYVNKINGRSLLRVDANALVLMNIQDFKHITIITEAIRALYQVEMVRYHRSISLPPRYPDTHFKLLRTQTGPFYENTSRTELWQMMGLVQQFPPQRSHWRKLHEHLQRRPTMQRHRWGYQYMLQLFKLPRAPASGDPHYPKPEVPCDRSQPCECMEPCECGWQEWYYRAPWTLSCLADRVVAGKLEDVDGEPAKTDHKCNCVLPYQCYCSRKDVPDRLTVLKSLERVCADIVKERGEESSEAMPPTDVAVTEEQTAVAVAEEQSLISIPSIGSSRYETYGML